MSGAKQGSRKLFSPCTCTSRRDEPSRGSATTADHHVGSWPVLTLHTNCDAHQTPYFHPFALCSMSVPCFVFVGLPSVCFTPRPACSGARQDGRHGAAMVRSEGLLACVGLLLSVPTVATLQLPQAAGPWLRPGPHASRAQRQQLSRGDVLRGALAVAATWASPHADSVRPVRTGCAPYAHRNGLLRALSAEAQGFVTVPASGVPYRTHTQPTLSGAPRVPPLAGRAGTDPYPNPGPNQKAGLATGCECG